MDMGLQFFFNIMHNKCLLCQDTWYDVMLYLSLELIPISTRSCLSNPTNITSHDLFHRVQSTVGVGVL